MIKFNSIYKDRVKYPIKLSALLSDLCNQVGLELGNTDFVNSDYMVLGNPFTNNEDCRTVLSNITQLAGGFAKIGRDNKVYIRTLKNIPDLIRVKDVHNMPVKDLHILPINMLSTYKENTEESLDGNNYFDDFSKNEQWGEVNSLVINISEVEGENISRTNEESITKNGLTEITITDNYFLINEEEMEKVIEPLWNALKGLHYLPFKTKYYGYPYLDSGDPIALDDTNDTPYLTYVFNHTFIFNGAFDGELETTAMTKVQTAYKNTQSIKNMFRKFQLAVDRINGRIALVIEKQDEQGNTFNSKIEETERNILQSVSENYATQLSLNNTITNLEGKISVTSTNILNEVSANYATQTSLNDVNKTLTASLELKVDTKKLISEINASADVISLKAGRLVITSGNFKLDGNGNITVVNGNFSGEITSNSGKIGGWTINSEGLSNGTVFIKNDGASTIYTVADLIIMRGYMMKYQGFEFSSSMIKHYDIDGDGSVTAKDYAKLQTLIGISMS